jgi:hypothetical protein
MFDLLVRSPLLPGRTKAVPENTMTYHKLEDDASIYQANIRAEDGLQQNGRWKALCEAVVIPLGFIVAFILALLLVILIRY